MLISKYRTNRQDNIPTSSESAPVFAMKINFDDPTNLQPDVHRYLPEFHFLLFLRSRLQNVNLAEPELASQVQFVRSHPERNMSNPELVILELRLGRNAWKI